MLSLGTNGHLSCFLSEFQCLHLKHSGVNADFFTVFIRQCIEGFSIAICLPFSFFNLDKIRKLKDYQKY